MSNLLSSVRQRPSVWVALLFALVPPVVTILITQAYLVREAPYIDQWSLGVYIATRAQAGTLTLGDLMIQYGSHRIIFSNLTTALFTVTNDWNLSQTIYIQVALSGVRWGLLVWLAARHVPRLLPPLMVLYALLVFYPTQLHLWEYSFNTPWLYAQVFFLLALLMLTTRPPGWASFWSTVFFMVCATYSIAVALVGWVILPIALWMNGYRQWRYALAWLGAMCVSLALYFLPVFPAFTRLDVLVPGFSANTDLAGIGELLAGVAVYLSASVVFIDLPVAVTITVLGFGTFFLLVAFIIRQRLLDARALSVWLMLAGYAVAGAVLTMLGRASLSPIDAGKQTRYFNVSMNLWIAVVTLCLIVMYGLARKRGSVVAWQRFPLVFISMFAVIFVVFAVLFTSVQTFVYLNGIHSKGLFDPVPPHAASDDCVRDFPLYRDVSCLPTEYDAQHHSQPEFIYQLAVYRLALFADEMPLPILPVDSADMPDALVIVSTPSEWLNLYVRDFILADVPHNNQLHLAQPAIWDDAAQFPQPLENVIHSPQGQREQAVESIQMFFTSTEHSTVWYLTTPESRTDDALLIDAAQASGYDVVPVPIVAPRYADSAFHLYELIPVVP